MKSALPFFLVAGLFPGELFAQSLLTDIPDEKRLAVAPAKYLAVFEAKDGILIGKDLRQASAGPHGFAGWKRLEALFPMEFRHEIEKFSGVYDGDDVPQPKRSKDPKNYPDDGSPLVEGNFVTSYAERNPGDEEVVETFTTYLTVTKLPDNSSLVGKKSSSSTRWLRSEIYADTSKACLALTHRLGP
jgi:hypothetical protein